jgi:hypothetical protein
MRINQSNFLSFSFFNHLMYNHSCLYQMKLFQYQNKIDEQLQKLLTAAFIKGLIMKHIIILIIINNNNNKYKNKFTPVRENIFSVEAVKMV